MVFVKVRETYDLHTTQNKMTVIGIHTPKPQILKANFPGLLMQCKAYRPVSCDVRVACASVLPLDPLGVGTDDGAVAPEDVFNPILYKACSNFGMSQIEARINMINDVNFESEDVNGNTAVVDVDTVTSVSDEFPIYYGLLADAHGWKHANPQSGLEMKGLKPFVYEVLYNIGDNSNFSRDGSGGKPSGPNADGTPADIPVQSIRGNAKPIPWINTTSYGADGWGVTPIPDMGFKVSDGTTEMRQSEQNVPWINCICGVVIAPPSRLHEFFYRMVVEWTIEFSGIRAIGEIQNFYGLGVLGNITHYQNYDYTTTKKALTGSEDTVLTNETCMVDSNVDVKKVM